MPYPVPIMSLITSTKSHTIFQTIQDQLNDNKSFFIQGFNYDSVAWIVLQIQMHWPEYVIAYVPHSKGLRVMVTQQQFVAIDSADEIILPHDMIDTSTSLAKKELGFSLMNRDGSWRSFHDLRMDIARHAVASANDSIPVAAHRLRIAPSTLYRWLREVT